MERFIGEKETRQTISNTFITMSFVILGLILAALLYWAYVKTDKLYITIFSFIVFAYTLMMVIFIALIRSKLTETEFKIYMSTSLFMSIFSLVIFGIFLSNTITYFRNYNLMYPYGRKYQPVAPLQQPPAGIMPVQQPYVAPSLAAYNTPAPVLPQQPYQRQSFY